MLSLQYELNKKKKLHPLIEKIWSITIANSSERRYDAVMSVHGQIYTPIYLLWITLYYQWLYLKERPAMEL